ETSKEGSLQMRAAWYDKQGPAREVLIVGEMPDPVPGAGEVRIRITSSGVNPGDIKKRQDAFGYGMAYPRVIPHSDGAGTVDQVGAMEPSLIVRSARRQSSRWSPQIKSLPCLKTYRWIRALASGYPASRHIAPSISVVP